MAIILSTSSPKQSPERKKKNGFPENEKCNLEWNHLGNMQLFLLQWDDCLAIIPLSCANGMIVEQSGQWDDDGQWDDHALPQSEACLGIIKDCCTAALALSTPMCCRSGDHLAV